MLEKSVSGSVQIDFFTYPNHPHNVRGRDRAHLMRKVLDYLMENNP
jgi:dipeptidyl-peptidase-4